MSTLPGDDALRDAGLSGPPDDEVVNLAEEKVRAPKIVEEYRPGAPRPDLVGEADEADVIEQSWTVPVADDEDHT